MKTNYPNYARPNRQSAQFTVRRRTTSPLCSALLAGFLFAGLVAQGGNILVNPGFEADGGHGNGAPITSWNFSNGDTFWINVDSYAHSGNHYYKVWGQWNNTVNYNAVWQDNSSLPTSTYQADGWMFTLGTDSVWSGNDLCYGWLEVSFRDAGDNILALYKSDIFSDIQGSAPYTTDVWYDMPITNVCQPTPPYAVVDSTNRLVAPTGTVKVRFQHTMYQPVTGGGSIYFDDANLNQTGGPVPPQITQVYPGNLLFASNHISFHVTSASSTPIDTNKIHLVVNGTDVSSGCQFSGASPDISVVYTNLTVGTWAYTASITVTDAYSFTASATMNFDTVNPALVWEAEDYDFTNGLYYTSPILSSSPQPNSYYGTSGVLGVDFSGNGNNASAPNLYRTNDFAGIGPASEAARPSFLKAQLTDPGVQDYAVGYIRVGDWMNYSRNYPAGTYNIYARLASGAGATEVSLQNMTSGTTLGNFQFSGSDWGAYRYIPLVDADGNVLPFVFDGSKQTLTVTLASGGDNMNFFMLVPAQTAAPFLHNLYPTNGAMFASNTIYFTADASPTTLDASGIKVWLNGMDVSSSLIISGSATTKDVICPVVRSNNLYTAVITVTNVNGGGVSRTLQFDTMRTDNFYVKLEDFDYNGGQWDTAGNGLNADGYYQVNTAISNIDYSHPGGGGSYPYRGPGLATEKTSDAPLPGYFAGSDYDVGNFDAGDWANYTRSYPAGKYFVYGRLAGYNLIAYLDQVTSGGGTTNQTTKRLGSWQANPNGWQSWAWVPLTDPGLLAPEIVTLGGTNTLRVTSGGNVNANYFMLVPAQGIAVSAAKSGSNVVISFPTQSGASYRVFYKTSLTSGNWTLLASVAGDGTVKSKSDPANGSPRYYKVTSP
jgi:hypothetical protein